jgi:hypothetical protein
MCDMGLAVASEWLFSSELKSGKVVAILQDWALPPNSLSAVYPAGRLASTKARAFVSFVERIMTRSDAVSPPSERETAESVQAGAGPDAQRVLPGRLRAKSA